MSTVRAERFSRPRLLGHDATIVFNVLLRAPATWRERIRWLVAIPLVILGAHMAIIDMPWASAVRATAGPGFLFAASLTRFAGKRLEFHRADGVRALDALRAGVAARYLAVVIGLGLLGGAILVALLDRRVLAPGLVAMTLGLIGGSLLNLAAGFAGLRRVFTIAVRTGSAWLKRPGAGLAVGAVFAAVTLWAGASFSRNVALGVLTPAAFVCGFALTTVNAGIVRFLAQSGHPVGRTLLGNLHGLLVFAPIAALAGFAALGLAGLGAAAAACVIVSAILCVRLLTYRLYEKRAADLATSLLVAGLGMVAALFPPAAPFALGAVLWPLWRRARAATWLLAA